MDAEGAFRDIVDGMKLAPLWLRLGWEQTVARFRRTVFGPFWLTANLLAISFALSVVFGILMGQDYRKNFAVIISGVLSWSLIGGVMSDASGVFISSGPWMQTMKMPLTFYIMLMMTRDLINYLAQLIALWIVLALLRLGSPPTWHLLIGLPIVLVDMRDAQHDHRHAVHPVPRHQPDGRFRHPDPVLHHAGVLGAVPGARTGCTDLPAESLRPPAGTDPPARARQRARR